MRFEPDSTVQAASDIIRIEGLEFYGYHGESDHEQTVGHRYLVDIELRVDTRPAAASDRLSDTVSYSRVAKRIVQIGTEEQFRLLETLANRLADTLLEEYCAVSQLQLTVRKMCPPMNAIVRSVGVEIKRHKVPDA
ncbi:MAG TPA: dihydroneopterin aldolase [Chthonomonadales bacterium]|nr:dihydroneopterin aldolase [Chthonomonadales bacterium]